MANQTINRTYDPTPTFLKFHNDNSRIKGVVGPVGAGKSVGCVMDLLLRSQKQRPFEGVRRTRWGIIRNHYPELRSTTLNTVKDWLPDEIFNVKASYPITGTLKFRLSDNTKVESEWVFLALDQPDDVKKLKSFEFTGFWMNEASELTKDALDMATSRIPRYPSKTLQGGASWSGIILDTNAPSEDSWWYELFEQDKPEGYVIYHQPPAVLEIVDPTNPSKMIWTGHPDAENINHLEGGFDYYFNQIPGKSRAWINVFLRAQYGESLVGRPVFAGEYVPSVHNSKDILKPDRSLPVIIGFDWGLFPAAVFGQPDKFGALKIIYEVAPDTDVSLEAFLEDYITPVILTHFQGCTFTAYGDPAGRGRSQIDKRTPFSVIGQAGIRCTPTYTNEFLPRRDAVAGFLNRRDGMLISAQCKKLRKGMAKEYYYEKVNQGSGEYKTKPLKNMASHVCDALQYLCLGIRGMNRVMVTNRGGSDGTAW